MPKTILIAAGGTGGHVFPGLAIADEFEKRGYDVQWLGTKVGLESRLVPIHRIKLNFFSVKGIRGRGVVALLLAPFRVLGSVLEAIGHLRRIKPVLVIGMGGFVAGPVGFAAYLLRCPLAIHEQNAIAGTTNKMLSKIANINMSAFPVDIKRVEEVGNPIRASLEGISKNYDVEKDTLNVLIVGGSRGARALNLHTANAIKQAGVVSKVVVLHQCGGQREQETIDAYKESDISVEIKPFIDDMDEAMRWADIMICRAGALTVSEIATVGMPSILIPYPYAIGDHQTQNAKFLVDLGAAELVQETEFEQGELSAAIRRTVNDFPKLKVMSVAAKSAARPKAAEKFVERCEELLS